MGIFVYPKNTKKTHPGKCASKDFPSPLPRHIDLEIVRGGLPLNLGQSSGPSLFGPKKWLL